VNINKLREVYRIVATEGAMLYFLLIQLNVVEFMYQYSLQQFQNFFFKAIEMTPECEDEVQRGIDLRQKIREVIYKWVSRGLFERHKQIFQGQLVFRLMAKKIVDVNYTFLHMDFLINCPIKNDPTNPNPCKKWLSNEAWGSVLKLCEIEEFANIANAIGKEASKRFEDWYNENDPENVPLPGDYRGLEQDYFKKLLVLRTLRPDRMTTALTKFFG
jgi:dynein heavy chain